MQQSSSLAPRSNVKADSLAFSLVFVSVYIAFFGIALLATILMLNWRSWFPGAESSRNLFSGVRAAVYTLMSHIT
jgi:light-harvesting complex 1 beta chain